jgi:hypothetical protein
MPSSDFQKYVRDLTPLSMRVEIKSIGPQLLFEAKGDYCNIIFSRSENVDGEMTYKCQTDPKKIIQGEFSLKFLGYFIRCTPLCTQIEVYLENDKPIVVKYNVSTLGHIYMCLSQMPPITNK